eukprot:139469-Chlamydomonas_euryale.AAC.1
MAYTSQSNGMAECAHRSFGDKLHATLVETGQPDKIWTNALSFVAYTLNRTPCRRHTEDPYELLYGKRPDVGHVCPFEAAVVVWLLKDYRGDKLQPCGAPARMLGYADNSTSMYKASVIAAVA